jgi:hypothetical protein
MIQGMAIVVRDAAVYALGTVNDPNPVNCIFKQNLPQ